MITPRLKPPTISAVIAAYQSQATLAEALDSVLGQTRPPDEVVVVDDGSTDATPDILASYGDAIQVIRQDNAGYPAAMNRAIATSTGDVVAPIGADDIWLPQKLEWQAEALERHPDVGVHFGHAVLFGRIVDVLSHSATVGTNTSPWSLLAAWVGFGLFTIVCNAAVALHADRLAHRQRQAVLASYFDHIMQLPLTFHSGTHSGRLMKVMLQGTDALWRLWLSFFREHFAAIMSLFVLLPLSLYINWRLAILLFILCIVFTMLTTLVVRKTYGLQMEVEEHYSDLAARASDALGNVALVQSFVRVDAEVQGLRAVADSCWRCRCRCCRGGRWSR